MEEIIKQEIKELLKSQYGEQGIQWPTAEEVSKTKDTIVRYTASFTGLIYQLLKSGNMEDTVSSVFEKNTNPQFYDNDDNLHIIRGFLSEQLPDYVRIGMVTKEMLDGTGTLNVSYIVNEN